MDFSKLHPVKVAYSSIKEYEPPQFSCIFHERVLVAVLYYTNLKVGYNKLPPNSDIFRERMREKKGNTETLSTSSVSYKVK